MDPKVLMELSTLIRQLPPEQLSRMQAMMHNMMAGFDVSREMEEFEKTLPPGFREKIMSLMGGQFPGGMPAGAGSASAASSAPIEAEVVHSDEQMDLRQARLTILRAVQGGSMTPEEAERLLFNS